MNSTMTNNDQASLINWVLFVNKIFTQYVMGTSFLLGNLGSIINCLVFSQENLRKSPCSMYFIACGISQFFTFNFALLTRILNFGYDIRAYNTFLWFCKVRHHVTFVFVAMPRYFIILASIDRYLASSRNALRRQLSSQTTARRLIIGNTIFWFLMYSHMLIFYSNASGQCQRQSVAYNMFISIQYTIDSGFLPLILMFIFGWLTLKSIRQIERRIRPTAVDVNTGVSQVNGISKKDLQLVKMLINQLGFYIILGMPLPFFLLYQLSSANLMKSPYRLTVELFISNLVHCLVYIEHSCTVIINISTSKLFRSELKRFIQTKLCHRTKPPATSTAIAISRAT